MTKIGTGVYYGMAQLPSTLFGKNPDGTAAVPIWRESHFQPTTNSANLITLLTDAETYDVFLILNLAGSRNSWCDPGPNNTLIYNPTLYEAQVRRFTVAGGLSAPAFTALSNAFASRRAIGYTVDEPQIAVFGGSITRPDRNQMGLLYKSIWPGIITAERSNASGMTPPPTGGWTGLDYGWSVYNRGAAGGTPGNVSARSFWQTQKAALKNLDLGMVPASNWPDQGDGRLWDYLNNGTSSGRIAGNNAGKWVQSPAEIREMADAIFDDPDVMNLNDWTYDIGPFAANLVQYLTRSDFVAARQYAINKCNSRTAWNGFRVAKGSTVTVPPEVLTDGYDEVTTRVITGSTSYVDIAGATLTSAELVAGKTYLISVMAHVDLNSPDFNGYIRTRHGSTAFADSEMCWQPNDVNSKHAYWYWDYWTAVAGEAITVQYRAETGQTLSVGANHITICAVPLSGLPAGSVVFSTNAANPATINGTAIEGGRVSFTPAIAAHDWLILTNAQFGNAAAATNTTAQTVSQILHNGSGAGLPGSQYEAADSLDIKVISQAVVAPALSATAHTYAESSSSSVSITRQSSKVLALDMSRFLAHGYAFDNTDLSYAESTSFPTQAQTASIVVPAGGSKVWFLGRHGVTGTPQGFSTHSRLQIGNVDQPPNQTAVNMVATADLLDVMPIQHQTIETLAAGTYAADLDAGTVGVAGAGGIVHIGTVTAAATSLTPTAHIAGDYLFATAWGTLGGSTAPQLPAGWTSLIANTSNGVPTRVGYIKAAAPGTPSGTWTNAIDLIVSVYRNMHPTTPTGDTTTRGLAASADIEFQDISFTVTNGTSWVYAIGVHETATNISGAPAGLTQRGTIGKGVVHDSNGGLSTWADVTKALNATGGYRALSVELIADPNGTAAAPVVAVGRGRMIAAIALTLPATGVGVAPVLAAIADKAVVTQALLSFSASATDADGDAITYSILAGLTEVPAGLTVNPTSGLVTWTPTRCPNQEGTWRVRVRATDNSVDARFDEKTLNIVVTLPVGDPGDGGGDCNGIPPAVPPTALSVAERAKVDLESAEALVAIILAQMQLNADAIDHTKVVLDELADSASFMQDVINSIP